MDKMWNPRVDEWATVLNSYENPAEVARGLTAAGRFVPWSQVLVNETVGCQTVLDLGSGRGEHSAVLARAGRQPTLVDWSQDNLTFSEGMFAALGLAGRFCCHDVSKPLPFDTNSFDAVFSCGVFEYFTGRQLDAVMAEVFRVARKRVIVMVPNAASVAYRVGKWYMERTGAWQWGGEDPLWTMRGPFRTAGARNIREYTVGARHSLGFLIMRGGWRAARVIERGLGLTDHPEPSWLRQGYLLVTVGDCPTP